MATESLRRRTPTDFFFTDQAAVSLTSTIFSPASRRVAAEGQACVSIAFNFAFDVLPQVTHRICGGEPSWAARSTRSRSFVSKTAFASLAARNILRSVALRKPKSLTGMASMPCVKMNHWAISGEICASIQIFTPRGWDDRAGCWQNEGKPRCLPLRDPAAL